MTGLTEKEEYNLRKQAGNALHRSLVLNNSFPSCLNCEHFEKTNELCKKFESHPPAATLVFSCGILNWEESIPF